MGGKLLGRGGAPFAPVRRVEARMDSYSCCWFPDFVACARRRSPHPVLSSRISTVFYLNLHGFCARFNGSWIELAGLSLHSDRIEEGENGSWMDADDQLITTSTLGAGSLHAWLGLMPT
ncbi:unnamed protein product [Urochloa humidicola]